MHSGCPAANARHSPSCIHLLLTAAYSWAGLQGMLKHIPPSHQGSNRDTPWICHPPFIHLWTLSSKTNVGVFGMKKGNSTVLLNTLHKPPQASKLVISHHLHGFGITAVEPIKKNLYIKTIWSGKSAYFPPVCISCVMWSFLCCLSLASLCTAVGCRRAERGRQKWKWHLVLFRVAHS